MPNLHENDFYNYCDWIGEAIPDYYTIYGLFRLVHSGDRQSEILFSLRPRSAGFADHEVPAESRPRLSKNPTILLSRKQFFTPHFGMV